MCIYIYFFLTREGGDFLIVPWNLTLKISLELQGRQMLVFCDCSAHSPIIHLFLLNAHIRHSVILHKLIKMM